MKKAKTHYTNYRNQGVNPHDFSRNLHREWFELIQFPTSREIESLGKLKILSLEIINKLKNKIRVIMMFQWQRQRSVMDVKNTFKTMMNVLHI